MSRVGRIDVPVNFRIAPLDQSDLPPGIISSLSLGHVEQNMTYLLEHQAEKTVNRFRMYGLQGTGQSDPDLADNAFEIVPAPKPREVFFEDRGGDP